VQTLPSTTCTLYATCILFIAEQAWAGGQVGKWCQGSFHLRWYLLNWGHDFGHKLMSFGQFHLSSIISLELHLGMFDCTWYHASYWHEITFNFRPHTIPIFKHWLPIYPWIPIFHPIIIIEQPSSHSHQSTCPTQMTSSPYLRTPLIWDGRPPQAQTCPPV